VTDLFQTGLRTQYHPMFERLWKAYPKVRGAKYPAFKSWLKLELSTAEMTELCEIVEERARKDVNWQKSAPGYQYVKQLTTWLNQRCWDEAWQRIRQAPAHHPAVTREPVYGNPDIAEKALAELRGKVH